MFLYDETIHVPLLLKLPDHRFAGKRVEDRVALVERCAHFARYGGSCGASGDAGTFFGSAVRQRSKSSRPSDRGCRRLFPVELCSCLWLERFEFLAHLELSLCEGAEARTLRSEVRSGSSSQSGSRQSRSRRHPGLQTDKVPAGDQQRTVGMGHTRPGPGGKAPRLGLHAFGPCCRSDSTRENTHRSQRQDRRCQSVSPCGCRF